MPSTSRDWDAYRRIWQSEDWARLHKAMDVLGLAEEFKKFEEEDWENDAIGEKWHALEDILTAFTEMQIRQGDISVSIQFVFTPQTINEHYTTRPMDLVTGWLQEGAEEFIRSMVMDYE